MTHRYELLRQKTAQARADIANCTGYYKGAALEKEATELERKTERTNLVSMDIGLISEQQVCSVL